MKKSKAIAEHFKSMEKIMDKFGIKRTPGRPKLSQDEKMVTMNFRVTEDQKIKVKQLGSGKWLRPIIEKEHAKMIKAKVKS